MGHPLAYSFECLYKHLSSVRINITEIREKILELQNNEKLLELLDKANEVLDTVCNTLYKIQKDTLKKDVPLVTLSRVLQDVNRMQHSLRTIRRTLQGMRLTIYTMVKDTKWLFSYFEPDFQSLIGNINEAERHLTEIALAVRQELNRKLEPSTTKT